MNNNKSCLYFANSIGQNRRISAEDKYYFLRKHRSNINGFFKAYRFFIGDIIDVVAFSQKLIVSFQGICIALRKKKQMLLPDTSFVLRNVILGVGIELSVSYYYNHVFDLKMLDYKRKMYHVRRSRLFYIRFRVNKFSRVT
jgi:ribosomal protein L19